MKESQLITDSTSYYKIHILPAITNPNSKHQPTITRLQIHILPDPRKRNCKKKNKKMKERKKGILYLFSFKEEAFSHKTIATRSKTKKTDKEDEEKNNKNHVFIQNRTTICPDLASAHPPPPSSSYLSRSTPLFVSTA